MDTMGLYGGFMLFCSHDRFLKYLKWLKLQQKPPHIIVMDYCTNIFYAISQIYFYGIFRTEYQKIIINFRSYK